MVMKAMLVLFLTIVSLSAGCSSNDTTEPTRIATTTAETPSGVGVVSDLVGRWGRVVTCRELTGELRRRALRGEPARALLDSRID